MVVLRVYAHATLRRVELGLAQLAQQHVGVVRAGATQGARDHMHLEIGRFGASGNGRFRPEARLVVELWMRLPERVRAEDVLEDGLLPVPPHLEGAVVPLFHLGQGVEERAYVVPLQVVGRRVAEDRLVGVLVMPVQVG